MKKLETSAAKILVANPEEKAVYMTEDGQGFFNKDARNNHAKERKLKVYDFFRHGVTTDEEVSDSIKALEVATEELDASKSALEIIEKLFTEEDYNPEVTTDTHSVVAIVVGVKERLAEAKESAEESAAKFHSKMATANEHLGILETDKSTLVDDLEKVVKANIQLQEKLDAQLEKTKSQAADIIDNIKTINANTTEITDLKADNKVLGEDLKEAHRKLAVATKKK